MKHLFLPYNLALKLKEKGFNEPCISFYHENNKLNLFNLTNDYSDKFSVIRNTSGIVTAPIFQQVVDWFIDKHFIYINTKLDSYREPYKLVPQIQKMELTRTYVEFEKYYGHFDNTTKGNYEALKKAIEEALKLI